MKKETIQCIRLIYGIVLGVFAVVAGICLIAACISIYRSGGEQIYTAEKVSLAFSEICVPVYLCLAAVILGIILDLILPNTDKKLKPEKNYAAILERLLRKRNPDGCDEATAQAIRKERSLRRRDAICSLALLGMFSIGFLIYGCNPVNFPDEGVNGAMVQAVLILAGCLIVPFGYSVFAAYRSRISLQREIELVKALPVVEASTAPAVVSHTGKSLMIIRCVILSVAIVSLVYGLCAGGTVDVLTKAVNICTECVGLG